MDLDKVRFELKSLLILGDRFVDVPFHHRQAKTVVSFSVAGCQTHRFPQFLNRLVDFSQLRQNEAQIVMRLRKVRPFPDCLDELVNDFLLILPFLAQK